MLSFDWLNILYNVLLKLTLQYSKIFEGLVYSSNASVLYPQQSGKMQLVCKLSKILHKLVSLLFFKLVVLNATFYSKSFSSFKHLQQVSRKVLFLSRYSEIGRQIS